MLLVTSAVAQPEDSLKMVVDFWQHDSEWNEPRYQQFSKMMEQGLTIDRYHYYDALAKRVEGEESKVVLYYKMSKLLTERSRGIKNAEELKAAALQLLPLAINEKSKFAQSWYYEHLGDFCLRAGELEKAVYYLLLTVDLHEEIGEQFYVRPMVTNVYFVAGRALLQTREYERSLVYIQKALTSLQATPAASVTDKYLNNSYIMIFDLMGSNYKKLGKYQLARENYGKITQWIDARKLDTNSRYEFWKGLTAGNIGQVLLAEGRPQEAKPMIMKGLEASVKYKDDGNVCEFYENLARIGLLTGNYGEAIANGSKAVQYLKALIYPDKIAADIYDVLHQTYLRQGQYQTAVKYLDLYHKHRENYQRLLETSELKKIEVELNYSKIRQQNTEKASEISKLTWLRNSLVILVIMVLIISILIYRNYRLKQEKKLKAIALEQERTEREARVALQQVDHFKQSIIEKEELILMLEAKAEVSWRNAEDVPESLKTFTLITEEGWNDFRMDFMKAYPKFLMTLRSRHGDFSTAEERLAMLIFLKLDNNKIAHSLGISKESVGKAKRRLRALLGFEQNEAMEDYIMTIS